VNLFAGTEHAKCAVRIPDESRPRTKMLEWFEIGISSIAPFPVNMKTFS
jgi:hypothetical protein